MIVFLLFFIAGLWMADGIALIFSPERVIATLRQSIGASPGFLRWGGLAALLGAFLLVGTWEIAYQPLWLVVGFSMIVKGVFLYAGSDLWRLRIVKWCLEREPVDYRIWGLGLCTLSVLLLDALNWGQDP
ncbi:MAG: hypothetical protein AB7P17_10950 [Nitrospirales bacterium]|nr:hypothetical protein [Nitrospirales bacterium]